MKSKPTALVSHIHFKVDMTNSMAPTIPLGVMLEVVWPGKGRWFGLVGRTQLVEQEKHLANLTDFPELADPWTFLSKQFSDAWEQSAGKSGSWLSSKFRWALHVTPPEQVAIPGIEPEHPESEWAEVVSALTTMLNSLGSNLKPPLNKSVPVAPVAQRANNEIQMAA
ncbi:MAG: hypothetical protein ACOZAM_15765 [Pseudomonadota bacterium]